VKGILLLLAVAVVLGATANAISPRGLSWTRPLGRGVSEEAIAAGLLPVDLNTVKSLLNDPNVLFVDARAPEEFATGRLPRAVNVPPDRGNGTARLTKTMDQPIVVYCANEFCEAALKVGATFKNDGRRNVAIFVDGYEAWWNAGGAVDQD
jgi:rhodanese-related sulfurtransferase